MMTLAADIGGSRIKLGLVENESVLARSTLEARSGEGLELQLPRIASAFGDLLDRARVKRAECGAVSFGFPAIVDSSTGRVLTAYGKYVDASRLDLRKWARREFGLDFVIENDARAALVGEWRAGAAKGCDHVVGITLGTGLGAAAIMKGQLVRGKHGQAGVLGGHFTVRWGGRLCTCGNRGCAEAEASTSVLPEIVREHPGFSNSRLRSLDRIDYAGLFRLAREQDSCAVELRSRTIGVWAAMVVNLVHAYDPERVIVGGGIMAGADDFFADLVKSVRELAHTPWGTIDIVPARLGDDAALIGCDVLAREKHLLS
jgi:glucokinase